LNGRLKGSGLLDKAPDAFRTISEVADDLDIPQHVLRFWETRFTQIKPMKRSGGRRYYRPDDVDLLRGIRRLLYGEGYTIRGVQRILKEHGIKSVQGLVDGSAAAPAFAAIDESPRDAADFEEDAATTVDVENDEDEVDGAASGPATVSRAPEIAVSPPRSEPAFAPKAPPVAGALRVPSVDSGSTAGKLDIPRPDIPRLDIARLDVPRLDIPRGDTSRTDAARFDTQRFDTSKSDIARPESPRLDVPKFDVPRLDIPRLKTALDELIACRQLLDQVLKEG
jgi:DNA-binding transcriptional MerR regulator